VGPYVVFDSYAPNMVSGDTNALADIFVRDVSGAATVRVNVARGTGVQADVISSGAAVSEDGASVGWHTGATNLIPGDTNGLTDVFVRKNPLAP
jgi:hypothetical protein